MMDTSIPAAERWQRIRRWLNWVAGCLALIVPLLICSVIVMMLGSIALWNDFRIQQSFRVYPDARQFFSDDEYECCDAGARMFYYETSAPIEGVRAYYETFTLPFIDNATMFHPYGEALTLGFVPYPITPDIEIDLTTDRECHFSQKWTCVQINLADLAGELPATISPDLNTGTLIIYKYWVETDMNWFLNS
jgi:hypothetical protein